ncbi:hypothetical protein KFL_001790040 [Klebsormidium nitens]|uniref:F420-0:Gamma-glutamyl ligase n=1 Tax=Klebsormidium nitens TaxID=105231 RepID=A0A1Y1I623_KLENI|nr:hypothetical protein KFL_001790040 [Klebsormidium nitens]|eukprot:GAQ84166.1 hypothetical protein KFL_001790040 [Klebsormidium nitens]
MSLSYALEGDSTHVNSAPTTAGLVDSTGGTGGQSAETSSGPYGPSNDLWLTQEVDRLTSMQRALPSDGLLLTRGKWSCERRTASDIVLVGTMHFHNLSDRRELFIPELRAEATLLASDSLRNVITHTEVVPRHTGKYAVSARPDGYWQAFILEAGKTTSIEARVSIRAPDEQTSLDFLQAVWFRVHYIAYGPHGRTPHTQHAILPLSFPQADTATPQWRKAGPRAQVLPIRTHLLSHLDDPLAIFNRYVLPHARPGDILALGETPLAIMQGRFRHPSSLRLSWVALWACRLFHPTSSLATACGMQALVDIVGQLRVVAAALLAGVARLLRIRGMFYNLAGEQARLIDDVSGTLPPYDQFICLGPVRPQQTVDALRERTGVEAAIVDVNDLRKCQVLAASRGVDPQALAAALLDNPAGNADEQTPLVLVRIEPQ